MADVAITLPTGEAATVPQEDLSRALDAGAREVPKYAAGSDEEFVNSGMGQALTGILGAGRAASGGSTDVILKNLAGLVGGREAEKSVAKAFSTAKEANQYADLAGETAGLFLGGGGLTSVGEAAEAGIAARVGEGLLGKVATGAGRGAAEGAVLGIQHQITEDAIGNGDHALSGEAMFASVGKDALLGGVIGGAGGALGYGLGRLFGKGGEAATGAAEKGADVATDDRTTRGLATLGGGPYRTPGPLGASTVDELVGAKGAAGFAKENARAAEDAISSLRRKGFTGDQAAEMLDGAQRVADAAASIKGATDESVGTKVGDWFAKQVGGNNEEVVGDLKQYFQIQRRLRESSEDVLTRKAVESSRQFTSVLRNVEDVANESGFKMRPDRMERLMKDVDVDQAADTVSLMRQRFHDIADQLAGYEGGATAKTMAREADKIVLDALKKESVDAGDVFMAGLKMKQLIGRNTPHLLPYETMNSFQRMMSDTYAGFRETLRDEGVWRKGAQVHASIDDVFSMAKPRRDDLVRTLGQTIDRGERGAKQASGDFEKFKAFFGKLTGSEADNDLEAVKSFEAFVDGKRQAISLHRELGDLTPSQLAKLNAGERDLNALEAAFKSTREEVSAHNRIRSMQLVEREGGDAGGYIGGAIGGTLGGIVAGPAGAIVGGGLGKFLGNAVTKPMQAMGQLASVANTVERVTSKLKSAVGGAVKGEVAEAARAAGGRSKHTTVKEIQHISELAGNPERMSSVVEGMFSGLSKAAPKIALEAKAAAMRAVTFLANEAPIALGSRVVFGMGTAKPRYSDSQLASWQAKRDAAFGALDGRTAPEVIVGDLQKGRLNRDAIRTIEYVSPKLYAQMQQTAQEQITKMAQEGKLDKLTLAQQASIASLLKVPPGEIWKPDFMLLMQSAKSYSQFAEQNKAVGAPAQTSKRAIKVDTSVFETDAQSIEGR